MFSLFDTVISMSIGGSIMILAVLIFRAVLNRKASPFFFVLLWILTLTRLLIPFKLPSQISIYNIVYDICDSLNNRDIIPQELAQAVENAILSGTQDTEETYPENNGSSNAFPSAAFKRTAETAWLLGVITFTAYLVASLTVSSVKILKAKPAYHEVICDIRRVYGIKNVSIRKSDGISSPMVCGFLHPVILLPSDADLSDRETLKYAVIHEYQHIRSFDNLLKLITLFALAVHWFNPLVWIFAFLFNRDSERFCDRRVLNEVGYENNKGYALAIVSFAERRLAMPSLVSRLAGDTKRRITEILRGQKGSFIGKAATLLLTFLLLAVFFTSFASQAAVTDSVNGSVLTSTEKRIFGSIDKLTEKYTEVTENRITENNDSTVLTEINGMTLSYTSQGLFTVTDSKSTLRGVYRPVIEYLSGSRYTEIDKQINTGRYHSYSDGTDRRYIRSFESGLSGNYPRICILFSDTGYDIPYILDSSVFNKVSEGIKESGDSHINEALNCLSSFYIPVKESDISYYIESNADTISEADEGNSVYYIRRNLNTKQNLMCKKAFDLCGISPKELRSIQSSYGYDIPGGSVTGYVCFDITITKTGNLTVYFCDGYFDDNEYPGMRIRFEAVK